MASRRQSKGSNIRQGIGLGIGSALGTVAAALFLAWLFGRDDEGDRMARLSRECWP